jgi:hypothetical protein
MMVTPSFCSERAVGGAGVLVDSRDERCRHRCATCVFKALGADAAAVPLRFSNLVPDCLQHAPPVLSAASTLLAEWEVSPLSGGGGLRNGPPLWPIGTATDDVVGVADQAGGA